MSAAGTPVICSARSRVNSAAYARNSSKPRVHSDDELPVVEPLGDDDVGHRQRQGAVGAGPQPQVDVGDAGDGRHARVDDDELDASLAGVHQPAGAGVLA